MTIEERDKLVEQAKALRPGDIVLTNVGLNTVEGWAKEPAFYEVKTACGAGTRMTLRAPTNYRGDTYDLWCDLTGLKEEDLAKAVFQVVQYKGLALTEGPLVERFLKLRSLAIA